MEAVLMKRITGVIAALTAVLLAAGCAFGPGTQDWTYYGLPGDYSLWRSSARSITIGVGTEKDAAQVVVDKYVSEIFFNDSCILAKQVEVPEDLNEKITFNAPVYFIITVADNGVMGPLGENAFKNKCGELGITDINWTDTINYAGMAE